MAEATLGRRTFTVPSTRVEVREWVAAHWEVLALVGLMVIAASLRFWDLGSRALHHDESLHAVFSYNLYEGLRYEHDPLMHGPFLFHISAAVYFLFGATDYTSRIAPALFGTALVGMPYLLKKQIGIKAVIIAAVFFTFSPTLLYYSRFDRNEAWMAVWTLAMVICIWRYLDEGRPGWLYGLAAMMALSFASKEVTFITVAIMLVFVNLLLAFELGKPREAERVQEAPFVRAVIALALLIPALLFAVSLFGLDFIKLKHALAMYVAIGGAGGAAAWVFCTWNSAAGKISDPLVRTFALLPFAWLVAAFWPLIGQRPLGRDRLPLIGDVMVIVGTLALPQFAAGIQELSHITKVPVIGDWGFVRDLAAGVDNKGYNVPAEDNIRITTVVVLIITSVYVGLLWKPKQWLIAAAFFYVPYVLLYTTFFTNQPGPWTSAFWQGRGGFFSGVWGSLDYWLEQHGVKRGNQPQYYYALMTPLYEFLPLLLAIPGAVWMLLKRDSFKLWLLFWFIGIFIGLSIAGEKMPWLEVHIALPLALIGAVALAAAIDALKFTVKEWSTAAGLGAVSALAVLLIVAADSTAADYAGYVLIGSLLGWMVWSFVGEGWRSGARSMLTVSVAVLLTLTVRAGTMASFQHGDVPVEMLVYTQTSPDIPDLRDRIDALARESGLGYNLPIVVDGTDGFSWPWAWYLRDYHDVSYPAITTGYTPPENAVLLVAQGNAPFVDSTGYSTTAPYKHRWWFIEESYRDLTVPKVWDRYTNPLASLGPVTIPQPDIDNFEHLGDFWLNRRSDTFTGSVNAVAFFPDSLSQFDVRQPPAASAPPPATLPDGRIIIGKPGTGQGLFTTPSDLFVDTDGNLWVADSRNNRIQKFDSEGNFVAVFGGAGTGPGRFNEPWSVAVDDEGFVYVADTWNHRIQKLAPDPSGTAFTFVKGWGEPYYGLNPGPFQMFGPRDIVIAPDGTLWVSDTGNKRLVNYSRDGEFIRQIGAPGAGLGQLDEPVGMAFDRAGGLFVADTWNQRLQRFAPDFATQTAYAAGWTSKEAAHKPYLAVLTDGSIVASDPGNGVLMLFTPSTATGQTPPLRSWRPEGARPVGVAALPGGGFAFSDAAKNEVQVIPADLVQGLFR